MKWNFNYGIDLIKSVLVLHVQFFLDSLEFQVNQANTNPALTIVKNTDVWTDALTTSADGWAKSLIK